MVSSSWIKRGRSSAAAHESAARELAKDETLRLPRRDGGVLHVTSGCVLVTQEGDPDDHVRGAGEEFRASGRGLAVAWALTRSDIVVADAPLAREIPRPGQGPATPISSAAGCCP